MCFFCFYGHFMLAQDSDISNKKDDLVVQKISNHTRPFDQSALKPYRDNPAYNYKELVYEESIWKRRFRSFINSLTRSSGKGQSNKIVRYILLVLSAIALYLTLRKTHLSTFFRPKSKKIAEVALLDISESEESFEEKLAIAESQKDYISATRWLYLLSLKRLNEKNIIEWKPEKLSSDYIQEVKDQVHRQKITALTRAFNHVFYGHKRPTENQYNQIKSEFLDLKSILGYV